MSSCKLLEGLMFSRACVWLVLCASWIGALASCATTGSETPGEQGEQARAWGKPGRAPTLEVRPEGEGAGQVSPDPVLVILGEELERHMKVLGGEASPKAYFISYTVVDVVGTSVEGSLGALVRDQVSRSRWLDVEVRVGDYKLDNTNRNRGGGGGFASRRIGLDEDPVALREALWLVTEQTWRSASEAFIRVQTNERVSVEEEDDSGAFSKVEPVTFIEPLAPLEVDRAAWVDQVKGWSAPFRAQPSILASQVVLRASETRTFMATSEGTRLQLGDRRVNMIVQASALADDGMELSRHESAFAREPGGLPESAEIEATIAKVIDDLIALRGAPVVEPWVGPVILSGRAAGVFFHEIFGHRVEGHRQRDERSGQTFTSDLGQGVLPDFLSVTDDPTITTYEGQALSGHYRFDDEGVPAQRVALIEDGVLGGFLTSRLPLKSVQASNGHGRRQIGRPAVARQGNLMVTPSMTVSHDGLRRLLIEELKRQGKPFGYLFDDISGGFTNTQRYGPQAFKVTPVMVLRVFADGRPDELVRGVDIAGTPKTVFQKIIAAADDYAVFNGYCGAESGWVPVSAMSPSLLLSEVEIEKKARSNEKGPILPAPELPTEAR